MIQLCLFLPLETILEEVEEEDMDQEDKMEVRTAACASCAFCAVKGLECNMCFSHDCFGRRLLWRIRREIRRLFW